MSSELAHAHHFFKIYIRVFCCDNLLSVVAPTAPCAGDVMHPKFEIKDKDVSLRALAPCQSLGAFYVAPTPAAQRFLAALAHWVMYTCVLRSDNAPSISLVSGSSAAYPASAAAPILCSNCLHTLQTRCIVPKSEAFR